MNKYSENNPMGHQPYTWATQFYREPHLPIAELKQDMKKLKALGLNTIKIQEAWSYDEPKEGQYDFTIMEELTKEAALVGLNVFFTVCLEVPAWAWKKYPDAMLISEAGKPIYTTNGYGYTDGKPGPCWNHPGMRKSAQRFQEAFAKRLGQHKNIVMWQAFQELNWWRTTVECYCPRCLALFRTWLKARYGTLEKLSTVWMIPVRAWDEIEPYRPFGGPSYTDWWRFTREQAGLMLKWRSDTLRTHDPNHRPISVNVSGPHLGQEWEWMLADNSDICGVSFYPDYFHVAPTPAFPANRIPDRKTQLPNDLWHTCLWYDSIRVATKGNPWASEFQAGIPGSWFHHGADPSPEDMRRWLLLTLSAGVKGVSFWNHKPEFYGGEAHRYGMFGNDMKPTPKTQEIGTIMKAVTRHQELFISGRLADVETAILVNDDTVRLLEQHGLPGLEIKAIQGLYRTLWSMGVAADFLAPADLASGKVNDYKVLILPFPLALSDVNAERLKAYVHAGGVLISEACPGRYSDRHMANLATGFAPGLAELLGCQDAGIRMCLEQDGDHYNKGYASGTWHKSFLPPQHLKGVGSFKGISLPASFYVESFQTTTGKPFFMHDGKTAGVVNSYGKGTTYLLGTFPSVAMMHKAVDPGLARTLDVIFKRAKITRNRKGKLIIRRLISPKGQVRFAINPTDKPVSQALTIPKGTVARDLLNGKPIGKFVKVDAFSVTAIVMD